MEYCIEYGVGNEGDFRPDGTAPEHVLRIRRDQNVGRESVLGYAMNGRVVAL